MADNGTTEPTVDGASPHDLVLARVRLRSQRRILWLRHLWSLETESDHEAAVTHAEVDSLLVGCDDPDPEAAWYATSPTVRSIDTQVRILETVLEEDESTSLTHLRRVFGLTEQETDLLHAVLAFAIDPGMARVCAYLNDNTSRPYLTEHTVARLFGHGHDRALAPNSALRRWELVASESVALAEPAALSLDPMVRDWLLGKAHLDEHLVPATRQSEPIPTLEHWPVTHTVDAVRRILESGTPTAVRVRIIGLAGSGRRAFAALIAQRLGLLLLTIDPTAAAIPWPNVYRRAHRQAWLDRCAIAWIGPTSGLGNTPGDVTPFPVQFAVEEPGETASTLDQVVDSLVSLPPTTTGERRDLWTNLVPAAVEWSDADLDRLASRHRVTPREISLAGRHGVATPEEAEQVVRAAARGHLEDLAEWLEATFTWDDLVVPERLNQTLKHFAYEARHRVDFWERDPIRRLFPHGRGLTALFSGPPGTGKTMAAQVVAADLGLDIFRIDLSTVVSKYIGETSANLQRILTRADHMDAVLLFDEADSLFGKRVEIRDAHDRYANTETNHLLQAIERYSGVAILATNEKSHIDHAFLRRLRYLVEFPKPDAEHRLKIWERLVGEMAGADRAAALGKGLESLAVSIEATGAHIKYAVLSGLFAAQRDSRDLELDHLLLGLEQELAKEGRSIGGREKARVIGNGR